MHRDQLPWRPEDLLVHVLQLLHDLASRLRLPTRIAAAVLRFESGQPAGRRDHARRRVLAAFDRAALAGDDLEPVLRQTRSQGWWNPAPGREHRDSSPGHHDVRSQQVHAPWPRRLASPCPDAPAFSTRDLSPGSKRRVGFNSASALRRSLSVRWRFGHATTTAEASRGIAFWALPPLTFPTPTADRRTLCRTLPEDTQRVSAALVNVDPRVASLEPGDLDAPGQPAARGQQSHFTSRRRLYPSGHPMQSVPVSSLSRFRKYFDLSKPPGNSRRPSSRFPRRWYRRIPAGHGLYRCSP